MNVRVFCNYCYTIVVVVAVLFFDFLGKKHVSKKKLVYLCLFDYFEAVLEVFRAAQSFLYRNFSSLQS